MAVAALPRWEEGDWADTWAPSVSGWKREEEEGKESWAVRDRWAGRGSWAGGEEKGERKELGRVLGREEEKGRSGERKGRGGGRGLKLFLFSKPFQLFKLLNLNSFQNLNNSSLFQIFQNIFQTFKTSHKQTINTMQPKDDAHALIASKIIKMIFEYFKGQIYLIIYLILRE
jgi:hypothetical protein